MTSRMRLFVPIALATAAAAMSGCGGDDGAAPASSSPSATSSQSAPGTTSPQKAASSRDCGDISGGTKGGDSVESVTAVGTSCKLALRVARAITIDGADAGPAGFHCPTASTYGAEKQVCTSGKARVEWRVRFE